MVRNCEEFIACVENGASMGLGPECRVVARKGENGAEHSIEHIKVRRGLNGKMEMIVQIAERPNDG